MWANFPTLDDFEEAVKEMKKDEWQPIDTAPSDGTMFLAYVSDEDGSFMTTAYCMDDGYCIPIAGDGDFEPSHWMPLPSPPERKDSE